MSKLQDALVKSLEQRGVNVKPQDVTTAKELAKLVRTAPRGTDFALHVRDSKGKSMTWADITRTEAQAIANRLHKDEPIYFEKLDNTVWIGG